MFFLPYPVAAGAKPGRSCAANRRFGRKKQRFINKIAPKVRALV